MGYTCVCGWKPKESGYHLTTEDYKAVFKHEKECPKYKEWWAKKEQERIIELSDDDDKVKTIFHRRGRA